MWLNHYNKHINKVLINEYNKIHYLTLNICCAGLISNKTPALKLKYDTVCKIIKTKVLSLKTHKQVQYVDIYSIVRGHRLLHHINSHKTQ
jgi:hypothetical protein